MSDDPEPARYIVAPCPRCGAVTVIEAEDLCTPQRDVTDEWTCPTTDIDGTNEWPSRLRIDNPAWIEWADRMIAAEIAAELKETDQ